MPRRKKAYDGAKCKISGNLHRTDCSLRINNNCIAQQEQQSSCHSTEKRKGNDPRTAVEKKMKAEELEEQMKMANLPASLQKKG